MIESDRDLFPVPVKNIARIRELLAVPLIPIDAIKAVNAKPEEPKAPDVCTENPICLAPAEPTFRTTGATSETPTVRTACYAPSVHVGAAGTSPSWYNPYRD